MANRYWVGGTASWDGTAGTKWAATSGGPGGETVPTSADDVFFDASSTGTVTIATGNTGAKSINCTGFTGTLAGTAGISVAGSITLVAGMTYTYIGRITFTSTATLITAGKTIADITIDATGSTVTLGDALTTYSSSNVTVTRGTFDTANYNVTTFSLSSNNSNTRTINLGSSTLTFSGGVFINFANATNLTFNAGTSQINASAASATLTGGGQTFYNLTFTSTTVATRVINGANTFNNLTLTIGFASLVGLAISADQTINGTLTCAGVNSIQRGFVQSDSVGTTRTITAAAISANDCDFRDITLAGAAAGAAPTRAGDCGGNSGITFPAAKTVYRVGTNTTWAGSSSWATSTGGTGSDTNFPLAQDTAIINNDTALTGTLAVTAYNMGAFDCSNRTNTITLNFSAACNWHGSFALGSGLTITGTSTQSFFGRGTMDFTSVGKTITFPITVNTAGGTFRLGDALTSSSGVSASTGTFNANNYNLTLDYFFSATSEIRTIIMGSGLWTLAGTGNIWNTSVTTNLSFSKDTANILLSSILTTTRTFSGGGVSFNKVTIGGTTGTSILSISGANNFTELASTKTVAHTVTFGANQGTINTWSITGSSGNVVTVNSNGVGTRRTFTLTNVTSGIDYLAVKDIGELSANKFYVGANSTDNGNNSNVYFTAAPGTGGTGNMLMLF